MILEIQLWLLPYFVGPFITICQSPLSPSIWGVEEHHDVFNMEADVGRYWKQHPLVLVTSYMEYRAKRRAKRRAKIKVPHPYRRLGYIDRSCCGYSHSLFFVPLTKEIEDSSAQCRSNNTAMVFIFIFSSYDWPYQSTLQKSNKHLVTTIPH